MLFYISLPTWSNIKLYTMVDRERFSVFRADHWVQKSGHPCPSQSIITQVIPFEATLQVCDLTVGATEREQQTLTDSNLRPCISPGILSQNRHSSSDHIQDNNGTEL
jgi:hypothetical protein